MFLVTVASTLDYLFADPKGWLHPVQVQGWLITIITHWGLRGLKPGAPRRWGGVVLATVLIGGSGCLAWGLVVMTTSIEPWLGLAVQTLGLASCFAGRGLAQAVGEVLAALEQADLTLARQRLAYFVGRDTEDLGTPEILRASLESLAENTVDGATAPLFYALLGSFCPAVGPWPLAIAYKAASTLDSMVGYKREPYKDWGWFSARLEDYLTWIPCRLTVLLVALQSSQPNSVLAQCWRDAPQDPSPNSGWSECVYAASLGVQLGGENYYQGVKKSKPLLAEPRNSLTLATVEKGLQLSRRTILLLLLLGGILHLSVFALSSGD
jgi:adenosylcobinamide-phosphate synthase